MKSLYASKYEVMPTKKSIGGRCVVTIKKFIMKKKVDRASKRGGDILLDDLKGDSSLVSSPPLGKTKEFQGKYDAHEEL